MTNKIEIPGYEEHSCNCKSCQMMCEISPCIPTPEQIKDYEKEGLMPFFAPTTWVDMERGAFMNVLAPKAQDHTIKGHPVHKCVFLNSGKCMLHDKGLKPQEGKLAKHDMGKSTELRYQICKSWDTEEGKQLIQKYSK